MPWVSYIQSLQNSAVSSAILSFEGADCGHLGDWKASTSELIKIARLLKECQTEGSHFNYGNEDFTIVKVASDAIVAHGGGGGLIFIKSKTLIIAAEYEFKKNSDEVEAQLSSKIFPIVEKLKSINY